MAVLAAVSDNIRLDYNAFTNTNANTDQVKSWENAIQGGQSVSCVTNSIENLPEAQQFKNQVYNSGNAEAIKNYDASATKQHSDAASLDFPQMLENINQNAIDIRSTIADQNQYQTNPVDDYLKYVQARGLDV